MPDKRRKYSDIISRSDRAVSRLPESHEVYRQFRPNEQRSARAVEIARC